MSKKVFKTLGIVIIVLIIFAVIFLSVDYVSIQKGEAPIFTILKDEVNDGGTKIYLGLGYKIIDFHRTDGYDEAKIGTWFMQYEDYKNEYEKVEKSSDKNDLVTSLKDIPQDYTKKQAIADGCVVIDHSTVFNQEKIANFITFVSEEKAASIRILQYTREGDAIFLDFAYEPKVGFQLIRDNTRDKFASEKDRKILKEEYKIGEYSLVTREEKVNNLSYSKLVLQDKSNKKIEILTYPASNNPSFFATVVESNTSSIIVEPYEGEEERKSSDKISISLGEHNDMLYQVGTNLKITYNGFIKETYPAQIEAILIDVKSVESFELIFKSQTKKLNQLIDKTDTKIYPYNIYEYQGNVSIKLDGQMYTLQKALLDNKITMEEIIRKANQDVTDKKIKSISYDDGGTIEYKYPSYTIIKLHQLDGNRDVYIGPKTMKLTDVVK